jgi:hypothetical protein
MLQLNKPTVNKPDFIDHSMLSQPYRCILLGVYDYFLKCAASVLYLLYLF